MTNLNPNPIMLTLDPKSDEETLPIKVLETQVTSSGDSVFVELDFKIDTLERVFNSNTIFSYMNTYEHTD